MRGGGCGGSGDGSIGCCGGDGGCGGWGRVSLDVVVGGGVAVLDVVADVGVVAAFVVVGGISAGTLLLNRPRWRRLSLAMLYARLVLGDSGA